MVNRFAPGPSIVIVVAPVVIWIGVEFVERDRLRLVEYRGTEVDDIRTPGQVGLVDRPPQAAGYRMCRNRRIECVGDGERCQKLTIFEPDQLRRPATSQARPAA